MKAEHQFKTFSSILDNYRGDIPLHRYLPKYFRQNKQMGSQDRRWASRYIYSYFRLGKALPTVEERDRLVVADFLCNTSPSPMITGFKPEWEEHLTANPQDKCALVKAAYPTFKLTDIFPYSKQLAAGINVESFLLSTLQQPDLFIRSYPGKDEFVRTKLEDAGVVFYEPIEHCFAMPNGTKLEDIFGDKKCYEVQDFSSQQTSQYFEPAKYSQWWDCCAASGGKSILLHGMQPDMKLLATDLRESMIVNLNERFREAGIKKYQAKVLDLLQNNDQVLHDYSFDGIILDAPCSGSGTWGRTPEMITLFEEGKIKWFQQLQQSIASNVVQYLKPGAALIYITCSVFKQENEEVVAYIENTLNLKLQRSAVLAGYDKKADTMFVARFIKEAVAG